MRRLSVLALLTITAATAAVPAVAAKKDPAVDKTLGPRAGVGKYLGGQDSPSLWHGCRKHDDQWYPYSLQDGSQTTMKSTSKYVAFTVNTQTFPTIAWTAKPGWKICGVVAYAAVTGPTTGGGQLLTYFTYGSDPGAGSTAANGQETVKIKLPKDLAEDSPDLKAFAGATVTPGGYRAGASFQRVTVYVKKG